MVSNPECSAAYLGEYSRNIQIWLTEHYSCELSLGWRDDHLDVLWEQGYTNADLDTHKKNLVLTDEIA